MDPRTPGMARYFREYAFYRVMQRAQERSKAPLMVSAARRIRTELTQKLRERTGERTGDPMNSPALSNDDFFDVLDNTMAEHVENYPKPFSGAKRARAVQNIRGEFWQHAGLPVSQRDKGNEHFTEGAARVARAVREGEHIPVSPFDPRWSSHMTVKHAGSELLHMPAEEVTAVIEGDQRGLHSLHRKMQVEPVQLRKIDENGRFEEAGPATTIEDLSGLSELASRMSVEEYRRVRSHALAHARSGTRDGQPVYDPTKLMSAEAMTRSVAVLDELQNQGLSYEIKPDRSPGQLKAVVAGTTINIRLTDRAGAEQYVGRVYDDGVVTRFKQTQGETYEPTAVETVQLVRASLGQEVLRTDGRPVGDHTYFTQSSSTATLPLRGSGRDEVAIYRDASDRSQTVDYIPNAEEAENRLRGWVDSARENYGSALDVDRLIETFEAHRDSAQAGEYFPEFSGDTSVAEVQRSYWDVLRGAQETLLKPGVDVQKYKEWLADAPDSAERADLLGNWAYHEFGEDGQRLDAADIIREHSAELVDHKIGQYDPVETFNENTQTWEDKRFDPAMVAKFMSGERGPYGNSLNVAEALRISSISADELKGESFNVAAIKDRMVDFNEDSAKTRDQIEDDFSAEMMDVVAESVVRNGGKLSQIRIDDRGIIEYKMQRPSRTGKPLSHAGATEVTGYIGQIFPQIERGEVYTQFGSGEDLMVVPGYEAHILPQKVGENLSVEERTRLRGYRQVMADQIRYQVASDVMNLDRSEIGARTSLNRVYRNLYDTRYPANQIERMRERGMDEQMIDAVIRTEAAKVRYPKEIAHGSTIYSEYQHKRGGVDPTNDNFFDPRVLTGRNMAIMGEESDGYFDKWMTNGAVQQGTIRYLAASANVDAEGQIIPGDPQDGSVLMNVLQERGLQGDFDPYDRRQMAGAGLLNAVSFTEPKGTAMMTFGGWTADDAIVISKRFAQEHKVPSAKPGAEGAEVLRELKIGDKLSDGHGNKGVISAVIDPEMDLAEAEEKGIADAVKVFRDNENLDVVMSPFSGISRRNGGTAREAMQNAQDLDLRSVGRGVVPGGIGSLQMIVTHKMADAGTTIYDEEMVAQGRGRTASPQLAWALASKDSAAVMQEFYGGNTQASVNFREMLVTMGMDMKPDGTVQIGYDDMAEGAARHTFTMPDAQTRQESTPKKLSAEFAREIAQRGGEMELPFELTLASGEKTPHHQQISGNTSYRLPVMSAHLRSGIETADGDSTAHDYTNQYVRIFENAVRYQNEQEKLEKLLDEGESPESKKVLDAKKAISRAHSKAQGAYDYIAADLDERRFSGKHNYFKEGLMSANLPNSATAVWTPDPQLKPNQVGMDPAMAESMGFSDGDYALIWRDPVLRDSGVRYMQVAITENEQVGISINPMVTRGFDGDFDGDSVAVVNLQSKAAKQEAFEKFSFEAQPLDLGAAPVDFSKALEGIGDPDAEFYSKLQPLNMHHHLDSKVTESKDPKLLREWVDLTAEANEIHEKKTAGQISEAQALKANSELMDKIGDFYDKTLTPQYGDAVLRFDSAKSHIESVKEACVDTGAKGSMSKLKTYAEYFGYDMDNDVDAGHTLHTREQDKESMTATNVKTFGVGVAGGYSQRAIKALRNYAPEAATELTYPVTQSVMQAKHNAAEAEHKYDMLQSLARSHWKGNKLELSAGHWEVVKDENGQEVQATPEEWIEQTDRFYATEAGLNTPVNRKHIETVAKALTSPTPNPETGRYEIVGIDDVEALHAAGKSPAPMDEFGYGKGRFRDFVERVRAEQTTTEIAGTKISVGGLNIFDGKQNERFAPVPVRKAREAAMKQQQALLEGKPDPALESTALTSRDVLPSYDERAKVRGEGRRSRTDAVAFTPKAPRTSTRSLPVWNETVTTTEEMEPGV